MKRILTHFVMLSVVLLGAVGCTCSNKKVEKQTTEKVMIEPVYDINTSLGTIRVKLYSKTPKHCANFEKLAAEGYYDGLLFHRVINGFMIQGGDPLTRDTTRVAEYGSGGPDYTVPAEFVSEYRHLKGALAAARRGDFVNPTRASSGSQFYIVQDENTCAQLDGQYTVFGQTIEGFEVIDAIANVETNYRDLPLVPVYILSVKKVESQPQESADTTAVANTL
jgi:cyclophilin family peptidyl-prolyl cis-trans isomerase